MAMVLPARLAVQGLGAWASDAMGPAWVGELIAMHLEGYRAYLRDPADGLYRHGYNYEKREASCCKWGRANGWLMMSRVEVLLGARAVNADGEMVRRIAALVDATAEHGLALCRHVDSTTGRLHQLVNETASFLETSATAMTHWAITTAVQHGFLAPRSKWDACIKTLWKGVAGTVDATGAVAGVCEGGPIYRNKTDYFGRPHAYAASACGGVGAVLRAATAMHHYQQADDAARETEV
jgi:rhamnogalacturonyl hydrolase YesR